MAFFRKHKSKLITLAKAIAAVVILTAGILVVWTSTFNIPDLESFDDRKVNQSTKIFDRTGDVLLFELHDDIKRTVIPFDEISPHMINATLAIEDSEFYEHNGVKPTAIIRATMVNLGTMDFSQGGSTITQQVVKNSLLTSEKTISRKIKEWVLAIRLDQALEKDRILELYLNEIPYGGNLYGVEEASQYYFDKSAGDLTVAESAYLASLPKAPTYYSPHGNNREALEQRKNIVLREMLQNDFISKEEYTEAKSEDVTFIQHAESSIRAPHFVFYIREQLEEKFGANAIKERGLRVKTTLDWELQQKAQEIVTEHAHSNETRFNAENAGMVAIDPKTGQILTMVGSRDYFDDDIDGSYNIALAERQPGSAFKPFVYATAINEGYTSETSIFDVRTQFSTACSPTNFTSNDNCYSPVNYDGRFRGPMTFRTALAQSVNVPAVKVLYLAGVQDSINTAQRMGIETLTSPERYGLTLVLGGGEVTLLDMTSAYGVFANDGVRNDKKGILEIKDNKGNVLEEFEQSEERAIPSNTARTISDMISDNAARTPAFGQQSYLHFPGRDVAAKTGTTNEYKDAWILGYTPNISVGAWAGNNDNTSMSKEVAGFIVAPMWNEFMQFALSDLEKESFNEPEPIPNDIKPVFRGIWRGGIVGTPGSDNNDDENDDTDTRSGERVEGGVHSILYWVDKNNPHGPIPTNPERDPQFNLWEIPVRTWADEQNIDVSDGYTIDDQNPRTSNGSFDVSVEGVKASYNSDDRVRFTATSDDTTLTQMEIYLNEEYIGTTRDSDHDLTYSFRLSEISSIEDSNQLRLVIKNDGGVTVEKTVEFEVD